VKWEARLPIFLLPSGLRKDLYGEEKGRFLRMKRRIETKVIAIEDEAGEKSLVILQCPEGETIAAKATVSANPIMVDQEQLVAAIDRINVVGKGKPSVHLGDMVEVQVFFTPAQVGAVAPFGRAEKTSGCIQPS
jgi:hypothetical protein